MHWYIKVAGVVLFLTACNPSGRTDRNWWGGDTSGGPTGPSDSNPPVEAQIASIILSEDSLSFASLGDTAQLTATVRNVYGETLIWPSVVWVSSDTTVATVYSQGQGAHAASVTAVGNGTATITVWRGVTSMDTVSATASVTVAQAAATLSFSDSTLTFASLSY